MVNSSWTVPEKQINDLVTKFFSGDRDKSHQWWLCPNPMLGGMSPRDMVQLGESGKLLRFVQQQLAQDPR